MVEPIEKERGKAVIHRNGQKKARSLSFIRVSDIIPNPFQPRKFFDDEKQEELRASLEAHGIIQPLVLTKKGEKYEILVGERRWRAAMAAHLVEVPAIIEETESPGNTLEMALVENLQREDLNPLEEAGAFHCLIEKCGYSHEEISRRLGKSRPFITNTLRLLKLPREIQQDLIAGVISAGHGRALLSLGDKELQRKALQKIREHHLSVRQTEDLVHRMQSPGKTEETQLLTHDWKTVEDELENSLGTRVMIRENRKGKGRIEIHYATAEDFERLIESLTSHPPLSRKLSEPLEASLL